MSKLVETDPSTDRFVFSSNIAAEEWHSQKDSKAYEWWYFDALSDDSNDAVVIVFLDNFVYSPRYNRPGNPNTIVERGRERFPAVSFTYYSKGKVVYRTEQEFSEDEFSAGDNGVRCRIGESGFRFDSASYGSGFLVSVDLTLPKGRRLRANLEWLSVEADLLAGPARFDNTAHSWNMAVPRADVSGKITMLDGRRRTTEVHSFRGTGYHDHNLDDRWLAKTVDDWHWGRAHFADATAVFCRYAEVGDEQPITRLILVRDGELHCVGAEAKELECARDKRGIRYPTRLRLEADGLRLHSRTLKVIDSSFYHLRFLSRMELSVDGREHSTMGITEFIAPRALKYRWLNWLSDLRTSRNGHGSSA